VQGARTREYVVAARALGVGPARTLWRHILPGVIGTVIVAGTFVAGGAVTLEAALSFLGAGVEPEIPSWGNMVAEGAAPGVGWWIAGFPGLAIVVTVTAINLLGDALRDALDPRQLPRT
jgi:peptide/nickel transport system permease protein